MISAPTFIIWNTFPYPALIESDIIIVKKRERDHENPNYRIGRRCLGHQCM